MRSWAFGFVEDCIRKKPQRKNRSGGFFNSLNTALLGWISERLRFNDCYIHWAFSIKGVVTRVFGPWIKWLRDCVWNPQDGPLLVMNGVKNPNTWCMALAMGNWGYNHYKWSYGPLLITGFWGPPCWWAWFCTGGQMPQVEIAKLQPVPEDFLRSALVGKFQVFFVDV